MTDLQDRLRATLHQVAATTVIPPSPTARAVPARPVRSRRRTAAMLAGVLLPVTGALAAGGFLPRSLDSVFSFPDDRGAGPASLRRIGTVPGPAGQRFELWRRPGESGQPCFLSALVPSDQPEDRPARQVTSSSGFCSNADGASRPFGSSGGGSDKTFFYDAGRAVRAEVRFADGTRLPAVVAGGQVAGWTPPDRRADAVLIGYDAVGKLIDTIDLTPWDPPPLFVQE